MSHSPICVAGPFSRGGGNLTLIMGRDVPLESGSGSHIFTNVFAKKWHQFI